MAFQREKPAAIGVKAPYPGFIEPELATSVDKVPSGTRWLHEIKFDGYRVQVHLRDAARGFRYGVALVEASELSRASTYADRAGP